MSSSSAPLSWHYCEGERFFRQRVILSLLTGKNCKFRNIRSKEQDVGLQDFEVDFLSLVQKLTDGTVVEVNHTGTGLLFKPGTIRGGSVSHSCNTMRSIGYYVDPLLLIAPFSKYAFKLALTGITTSMADGEDLSVDALVSAVVPTMKFFSPLVLENCEFRILKRGAAPLGGGEVLFTCPIIAQSVPWELTSEGKIVKIRGMASTTRISPQVANRMVEAARGLLNQYTQDIFITTDAAKGKESGQSAGYNLFLVAESTTGALYFSEAEGKPNGIPEELAGEVCQGLLKKIARGGAIDERRHLFFLTMMALGPEDFFSVLVSKVPRATTEYMKEIEAFLGVKYRIKEAEKGVIISTIGRGFLNFGKRNQ